MALTMACSIDLFLYGILLVLFMVFFGIPSIQKYQDKETIFLSSEKLTNGIEAPAITIIAVNNNTGYGWKTKNNQTSSAVARFTHTFLLDHCKEINQTDLETCISEDSFGLTDFLTAATFGMRELASSEGKLNRSSWKEDMDITANGRHFTWNPQKLISPELEHFMFMTLFKNLNFFIFVHDPDFYVISTNPFGTGLALWEFEGSSMTNQYQELTMIKQKKLNLVRRPCEEAKDYKFTTCVMESFAEKVGCRRPWDNWTRKDRAICTEREQFKQFDKEFELLMIAEVNKIERSTGCLKPCEYKEYKFINTNPKPMLVTTVPADQIAIGLWTVSEYTRFEEEGGGGGGGRNTVKLCLGGSLIYQSSSPSSPLA